MPNVRNYGKFNGVGVEAVISKDMKTIIAHAREGDVNCENPQTLWKHLTESSEKAKEFAGKINLDRSGELIGLLHDLGKASQQFQNYIRSAVGNIDPDEDGFTDVATNKGKVDHSTAGAQLIYNALWGSGSEGKIVAQILSVAIASHHSGLMDCLTPSGVDNFTRRMKKSEAETHVLEAMDQLKPQEKQFIEELLNDHLLVSQLIEKLNSIKEKTDTKDTLAFKHGLLIRYLFSCVLDADRLSTANFEVPGKVRMRNSGKYRSWEILIEKFNAKVTEFDNKPDKNEVDHLRNQVSLACLDFASKPKGIYQLTVPTGGGKTMASLRFALHHAAQHKMDKVYYIIPFTSIIDQNADDVRKVLEDRDTNGHLLENVVLEHHSNLTPDEESKRHSLLAENWDARIIFTTQVQFFEVLFGSGTRGARRMHQLANSVIIFDEIQTIPLRIVQMFNVAIRFLVTSCGASVVLCTATQPLLQDVKPPERAIPTIHKIIQNETELFEKLKRVDSFDERKVGGWSNEETAKLVEVELEKTGSVLLIVNTKDSARNVYQAIKARDLNADIYHLSTNMCPAHRLDVLNEIRKKLKEGKRAVCVSTQLIEAGVDIDFGSVIRHLAGLDSMIQAAGRCNREGHRRSGNLIIINPESQNLDLLKEIKVGSEKSERILDEYLKKPELFDNDRIGLKAMNKYFRYYFHERQNEMNYPVGKNSSVDREDNIFNLLAQNFHSFENYKRSSQQNSAVIPFRQSFKTAATEFRVIDSPTRGVVVPYGKKGQVQSEGDELIADLCGAFALEKQFELLKKAQRYSVNLYPYQLQKMAAKGAITEVRPGSGILFMDKRYYHQQFGWSDEAVNGLELNYI